MNIYRICSIVAASLLAGFAFADVSPLDDSSLSDVSGLNNNGIFYARTSEKDQKKTEEEIAEMRASLRQSASGVNDYLNKENTDKQSLDRQALPNYDASRDAWKEVVAGTGGDVRLQVGQGNGSQVFGGNTLGGMGGGGMDFSGTRSRVLINNK